MHKRSPEPGNPPPSFLDRLKSARIRLIGAPQFQKFAADFPLTRPIARANAEAVFDLCAGFVYSQVLLACVELKLLETLRDGDATQDQLSNTTGLPSEGLERLLKAACALKLTEPRSHGRYGLGPKGAALLANPGVLDMVQHHKRFYADLAAPAALMQDRSSATNLARFWPYAADDAGDACAYSALMGSSQSFVAENVLDAFPIGRFESLLDVGGGDGTFLRSVARRAPKLKLALMELPDVADIARKHFETIGLDASVYAGNMLQDPWPDGQALISLVRILHDHDDDSVARILRAARQALSPGGSLLVAEPTADTPKAGDAYFGLYLWAIGSGRPRRLRDIKAMLHNAGFNRVRTLRTRQPLLARALLAT